MLMLLLLLGCDCFGGVCVSLLLLLGGTGLGLAISKSLVEAFGGKIWIEDNKQRVATTEANEQHAESVDTNANPGSTFHFYTRGWAAKPTVSSQHSDTSTSEHTSIVPVQHPSTTFPSSPVTSGRLAGTRVLLIKPNVVVSRMLCTALRSAGAHCDAFPSIVDAIEWLNQPASLSVSPLALDVVMMQYSVACEQPSIDASALNSPAHSLWMMENLTLNPPTINIHIPWLIALRQATSAFQAKLAAVAATSDSSALTELLTTSAAFSASSTSSSTPPTTTSSVTPSPFASICPPSFVMLLAMHERHHRAALMEHIDYFLTNPVKVS